MDHTQTLQAIAEIETRIVMLRRLIIEQKAAGAAEDEPLRDVDWLARRLGYPMDEQSAEKSRQAVYWLISSKSIPADAVVKIGKRQFRVKERVIQQWIANGGGGVE
jgi:hypothetical protein